MKIDTLTSEQASHLLERADSLQVEGEAVLADLDLARAVAPVGALMRIGSSTMGLMAWRDLDFSVMAMGLSLERLREILRPLMEYPRVKQVRVVDESGALNPTGLPVDERFYVAVHVLHGEAEWKLDIGFWLRDVPRPEAVYAQSLRARLTEETRLAILWIKDVWHLLPEYRRTVGSMDIYEAVLGRGVRTPGEFAAYLMEKNMKGTST